MRPIKDNELGDVLVLADANGHDGDGMGRPWLAFNKINGTVVVADDYETSNDETARDFVLTKPDAIKLASALLDYAQHGATSAARCVSQFDVEDMLKAK
jgi:hypothetical protein